MTITRVGSTRSYAENWAKAFGKGDGTAKKQAAAKRSGAKKKRGGSTARKPAKQRAR